jgi:hypothetical protein
MTKAKTRTKKRKVPKRKPTKKELERSWRSFARKLRRLGFDAR